MTLQTNNILLNPAPLTSSKEGEHLVQKKTLQGRTFSKLDLSNRAKIGLATGAFILATFAVYKYYFQNQCPPLSDILKDKGKNIEFNHMSYEKMDACYRSSKGSLTSDEAVKLFVEINHGFYENGIKENVTHLANYMMNKCKTLHATKNLAYVLTDESVHSNLEHLSQFISLSGC